MVYAALVMVIIKILLDLFIYVINRINQHENEKLNSYGTSCKFFHEKDNKDVCTNILFKQKMSNGVCPRDQCLGFNTGKAKNADNTAFVNVPWLFSLKKIIDLFPEFAAALLALNEILIK